MKNFLFYLSIVLSVIIISFGHFHYQAKLASAIAESNEYIQAQTASLTEELDKVKIGGILGALAEEKKDEDDISITVLGASSLASVSKKDAWPALLRAELEPLLVDHELILTVINVDEATSADVLKKKDLNTVIDTRPDLLLIEPFSQNDYHHAPFEENVDHLDKIITKLEKELPKTKIIFLPANPIPGDSDYSDYVYAL
jgi:hypothetical protein